MHAGYACVLKAHSDIHKLHMHIEGAFRCINVVHLY